MAFPNEKELKKIRKKMENKTASRAVVHFENQAEEFKHMLCKGFVRYANRNKLNNREMAKLVGIDEGIMSKILHYKYSKISIDRLLKYSEKVDLQIKLKVAA